ncbi:MAG TPA: sugar nucleotide-binding protein, partial [Candidatus Obscuribacter sp.]|nr:sugar nucleotide-binding protein [Candidatus Obscuribacter sp.]
MRDLVIGASGQVGGALVDYLNKTGVNTVGTYFLHNPPHFPLRSLDITASGAVQALLEELCPRHVYLPSSYTNVDGCEEDP